MAHQQEWGNDICQAIINRRVRTGMTKEKVVLTWGRPNKIDHKENTTSSHKEHWVYAQPRRQPVTSILQMAQLQRQKHLSY